MPTPQPPHEMDVTLLPFGREDFDRLMGWITSEAEIVQWAGPYFTFPFDRPQLEAYLASSQVENPPRLIFKAAEAASGQVVGHIELNNIDRRNRAATVSKVLVAPSWRGKGAATGMVRRLLEIGFGKMALHRISLFVFDFNTPALRCYEKLGFQREGYFRDYRRVGEVYWSSVAMALLEDEWRAQPGPAD